MKKNAIFIICLLPLFFSVSCSLFSSSKPQVKHYYQIHYEPEENGQHEPFNATLRIKTLDADKIYQRYNIVYRTSYEEMFYYNTHFWASRPSDMITDLVANHFSKQQVFSDIILSMEKKPKYVLSGRIRALDEFIEGEKSYARVSIVFELKDYKTNSVVVSHSFEKRKEAAEQKPLAVVQAMGEIINSETEVFIAKINEFLEQSEQTSGE